MGNFSFEGPINTRKLRKRLNLKKSEIPEHIHLRKTSDDDVLFYLKDGRI